MPTRLFSSLEALGRIYFLAFSSIWSLSEHFGLLAPSSTFKAEGELNPHTVSLGPSPGVTAPSASLLLPLSAILKDPCDYIGPTQTIQNNVVLGQLTNNLNSLLPHNAT